MVEKGSQKYQRLRKEEKEGYFIDNSAQSLMSRVRSMFTWIAQQVTKEAIKEKVPEHASRPVTRYSTGELIRRAEAAVAHLELSKQLLIKEYGESAQGFVLRYIDPVVEPVKRFITEGKERGAYESVRNAIGSVEMLGMLHDESRLRRKICDTLEHQTREVILEDIAFLMSYPNEAIEEVMCSQVSLGSVLRHMERELQPILLQFESLLSIPPPSHEFTSIYQWRLTLDARRQQLHDHALQVIEGYIQRAKEPAERSEVIDRISELFGEISWPPSLFDLDELSSKLRQRFERSHELRKNPQFLAIFEFIKTYLNSIIESEESVEHDVLINRIISSIKAIEEMVS